MEVRLIAELLNKSRYTVCLSGREMLVEDGIDSMRNPETAYDIEMKYGYSPEEVFSARFFNTRAEQFYEFYRDEVLGQDKEPGPAYAALAQLEAMGVLQCTITRQLFNFPKRAGCRRVYNLHGNIYEKNHCPHCGRTYTLDWIRTQPRVPLCETCRVPVHPGVTLLGEMVEIGVLSKAAEEVSKADTLLLAGTFYRSEFVQQFLRYFQGSQVIMIHAGERYGDREADYFVDGSAAEVLPGIVRELRETFGRTEQIPEPEEGTGKSPGAETNGEAEKHAIPDQKRER